MSNRLLSGVKPTGDLHIGNYFGAIKQFVDLQYSHDAFIFIADIHALNQVGDPEALRKGIYDVAATYLAVGLDPEKVTLFQESAVSGHAELAMIIGANVPVGLLERAHAYKDSVAKGRSANFGLFSYPVLMAADILLYKPQVVPVGKDQQQHVEIAIDLAEKFNFHFGDTFPIPEGLILEDVATVPGTDGQKMSKSYNNVIGLFDAPELVKKKVMSIPTDSKAVDEPKDAGDHIMALYRLFSSDDDFTSRYLAGGVGYGEAKGFLAETINAFLEPIRQKRLELDENPKAVLDILEAGADAARIIADATVAEAKERVGLILSNG